MKASKLLTANGNRVNVGNFDENGWYVNNNWPDNSNSNLAVVVSRNFFSL